MTPEYNRSVPGVLKNAIDVDRVPMAKASGAGKPAGIISISPGAIGGFGANHHLRQSLVFLNMPPCNSLRPISGARTRCSMKPAN